MGLVLLYATISVSEVHYAFTIQVEGDTVLSDKAWVETPDSTNFNLQENPFH